MPWYNGDYPTAFKNQPKTFAIRQPGSPMKYQERLVMKVKLSQPD